jgi:hypothetical protein
VQVFADPSGDATAGPDITGLTIGDAKGILTFRFVVPGLKLASDSTSAGAFAMAFLDTDRNGSSNYELTMFSDSEGFHWDVTAGGKEVTLSPTMTYTASGDTHTFTLSSADLGGTTGFNIAVHTATMDESGAVTQVDRAPDAGVWSYTLTSINPVLGAVTTSPAAPVAGKALALTVPVTRSDDASKITTGATFTVDPKIGGVLVRHTEQLKNGTVFLRLPSPRRRRASCSRSGRQ